MQTVAFCEIEPYCQKVLKRHWPDVPIFEDVRTLRGDDVGSIDLICGGYPCQPFSLAGGRRGQDDDRHLWPEMFRLLQETGAPWFVGENVAGHISMGLDEVLSDLEGEGYEAQTFVIPACAIDAPHRRDRVWVVANARGEQHQSGCYAEQWQRAKELFEAFMADTKGITKRPRFRQDEQRGERWRQPCDSGGENDAANPDSNRRNKGRQSLTETGRDGPFRNNGWPVEPPVGRVAHGVPRRVDRLRALGNAVVPQIPEIIGQAIMAIESDA